MFFRVLKVLQEVWVILDLSEKRYRHELFQSNISTFEINWNKN